MESYPSPKDTVEDVELPQHDGIFDPQLVRGCKTPKRRGSMSVKSAG